MDETMKPTSRDWPTIAVALFTALNAFLLTWGALNDSDEKQDKRLSRIEFVLCATKDVERAHACEVMGLGNMQ
jgi:hypothetical protein